MGDGMVTFHVLGAGGLLGSVVARRWRELGAEWSDICTAEHIINCVYPDSYALLEALPKPRVIQPSTDAIDEDTTYAATKREVERMVSVEGGLVLRSGLVDPRRQPDVAYANWLVNPLTPLEWADLAWELRAFSGVHPDGRETLSKYSVAVAVADAFDLARPAAAMAPTTRYRLQRPSREWPLIADAIAAWRDWT